MLKALKLHWGDAVNLMYVCQTKHLVLTICKYGNRCFGKFRYQILCFCKLWQFFYVISIHRHEQRDLKQRVIGCCDNINLFSCIHCHFTQTHTCNTHCLQQLTTTTLRVTSTSSPKVTSQTLKCQKQLVYVQDYLLPSDRAKLTVFPLSLVMSDTDPQQTDCWL